MIRRHHLREGHVQPTPDAHWAIAHPLLWKNVVRDFHHHVLRTGHKAVLEVPAESEEWEEALRAGIRLWRAVLSTAPPGFLHDVWAWVSADLRTELFPHGMLQSDKFSFILRWDHHRRFLEESNHIHMPADLRTFVEAHWVTTTYESTVLCGLVFLETLLDAHQGKYTSPFEKLWTGPVRTPYVNEVAARVVTKLRARSKRGFSAADKKALLRVVSALERSTRGLAPPSARSDQRWIRDALGHGKYVIGHDGTLTLDVHEHRAVGLAKYPRKYSRSHPYLFKGLNPKNTRVMRRNVTAYGILFWAVYYECERSLYHRVPAAERRSGPASTIKAARVALRSGRLTHAEKAARLATERAAERRARERIEVKAVPDRAR